MASLCSQCDRLEQDLLTSASQQEEAELAVMSFRAGSEGDRIELQQHLQRQRARLSAAKIAKAQAQARLLEHLAKEHSSEIIAIPGPGMRTADG